VLSIAGIAGPAVLLNPLIPVAVDIDNAFGPPERDTDGVIPSPTGVQLD